MKIAICDDDPYSLESFLELLESCRDIIEDMAISSFSSGEELLKEYESNRSYDLLFLDIEMPGINGLETGEKIREIDENAIIVFLTAHMQFMAQSLKIEILDYLSKPASLSDIQKLLDRAYRKYKSSHFTIHVKWQSTTYSLHAGNIIYVEGYKRHTKFCTLSGKYECVGKLKDFHDKLAPYGFIRCHQGFLINMKFIESFEKNRIVTSTGLSVSMSNRKRSASILA